MNFKLICLICTILLVVNELNAKELDSRISGGIPPLWRERFAVRIISAVNDRAPQGYLSTGVAVTQQHVVTVAQAISGFSIWRIGYGDTFVERQYEVICRNAVAHPEFNSILLHNNVGVIRVPYVLPNWLYSPIGFLSNTPWISLVSGYGFVANDQLATELQVAQIAPLPLSTCSQFFGEEFVRNDNLCFRNGNINDQIRNGDQGGPAFYNTQGTPTFGIISFWGLTPGSPIVLIDLQEHQSFLEMQLAI